MEIILFLTPVVFVLSLFSAIKAIRAEKSSLFFELIAAFSFAVIVWGLLTT